LRADAATDSDDDFTSFAAAQWVRLVRSAVLLGCSTPEAEDLAQTTLMRCYVAWRKVSQAADRDAYVYRILFNTRADSRRRRRWREVLSESISDCPDDRDDIARVDEADAVRRALSKLSQAQRDAIVLRFYGHLDERQISQTLGIAAGTVKSRLSRGLALLSEDATLNSIRGEA
jgi:RNA polymerase sigma-70 factor (sigma-E family)